MTWASELAETSQQKQQNSYEDSACVGFTRIPRNWPRESPPNQRGTTAEPRGHHRGNRETRENRPSSERMDVFILSMDDRRTFPRDWFRCGSAVFCVLAVIPASFARERSRPCESSSKKTQIQKIRICKRVGKRICRCIGNSISSWLHSRKSISVILVQFASYP